MASPTWKAFDGCLIQRDEDEDRAKVGRLVGKIEDTHAELASHPKNNLTHIQDNTANTVEPLEALRVEQTKTNVYLKAILEKKSATYSPCRKLVSKVLRAGRRLNLFPIYGEWFLVLEAVIFVPGDFLGGFLGLVNASSVLR